MMVCCACCVSVVVPWCVRAVSCSACGSKIHSFLLRYRRLLPDNIEKEREREKRRKRAEGAKNPPANKKKRFDGCGRATCAANVAPMMALRYNGACLRMECTCGQ